MQCTKHTDSNTASAKNGRGDAKYNGFSGVASTL